MITNLSWKEVSPRTQPCPICHKTDWCAITSDGQLVVCRRIDTGEGRHKIDRAGTDYWLYNLNGNQISGYSEIDFPSEPAPERTNPDTLDDVYRALLGNLSLESTHKEQLLERGLTEVDIKTRGYRSLPNRGRAGLTRQLVDRFGAETCSKVPGLYIKEENDQKWWSLAGLPGILIPVRDFNGQIIALKIRADVVEASDTRYRWLSSSSHDGPSPGSQVHVPLFQGDTQTLRITEGELKADVATAFTGILTLSAPGVSTWRPTIPILEALNAKTVILAFDADARKKATVAGALQRLFDTLAQKGFEVIIEIWPENLGKGIDDLLQAGHQPESKTSQEAQDTIAEILTEASMSTPQKKAAKDSLEKARKLTDQTLSRVQEDPGAAFEPKVRKAWKLLQDDDPMSWARAKRDLKKAGVSLTELNRAIKKDHEIQTQEAKTQDIVTIHQHRSESKRVIAKIFQDSDLEPMRVPIEWILTEQEIFQIKSKPNGEPQLIHASYYPIIITAVACDIDTGEEHLTLHFKKKGRIYKLTADRRTLADQRRIIEIAEQGFPVNSVNAKQIIRYLEDFEAINIDHLKKSSITHGFGHKIDSKGNPIYFLPGKTYNTDESLTFHGRGPGDKKFLKALHPKGKLQDWIQIVTTYCLPHHRVMFAIYAGFAVPLLKLFGCTQSFVLHFYGLRSCGKTTQNQVVASIYGNPAILILQWNHITQVAAEQHAALFNGLPIFLDDSQNADERRLSAMIYLIANGIGKARGYKFGGLQETLHWLVIAFSTGEQQFFDITKKGGAEARNLSLHGSPFGSENDRVTGKAVRELKRLLHQNYGTAIRPFLDHVFSLEQDRLMQIYEESYQFIEDHITEAGEVHRYIDYFASILAAGILAEEALDFGGNPHEVCKHILALFQEKGTGDVISDAMEDVISWVNSNDNLYDISGQIYEDKEGGFGTRHGVKNPGEYVAVFPHTLKEFLVKQGYSPSMVLQGWKDREWIQTRAGKMSYNVSYRGKSAAMIKIPWEIYSRT